MDGHPKPTVSGQQTKERRALKQQVSHRSDRQGCLDGELPHQPPFRMVLPQLPWLGHGHPSGLQTVTGASAGAVVQPDRR